MIWYLPIEPMEERYTAQMRLWVVDAMERCGEPYQSLEPTGLPPAEIQSGQFLDDTFTFRWKALQLDMMAQRFHDGVVQDGDVILLGDAWFPGVASLRIMSELRGIRVKIVGWHYAGVFDPDDYYAKTLGKWSAAWEANLLANVLDLVCVGSHAHRALLLKAVPSAEDKIHALGLAWRSSDVSLFTADTRSRLPIVAFPHRVAEEKGIREFTALVDRTKHKMPKWNWCVSSNRPIELPSSMTDAGIRLVVHRTKSDYYAWLARCGVWISTAHQETFGYSLHEAIALRLPIVAPNRAAYPEMLCSDGRFLYDDDEELNDLLASQVENPTAAPLSYTTRFDRSIDSFLSMALSL